MYLIHTYKCIVCRCCACIIHITGGIIFLVAQIYCNYWSLREANIVTVYSFTEVRETVPVYTIFILNDVVVSPFCCTTFEHWRNNILYNTILRQRRGHSTFRETDRNELRTIIYLPNIRFYQHVDDFSLWGGREEFTN